jgi:hypothetical protein
MSLLPPEIRPLPVSARALSWLRCLVPGLAIVLVVSFLIIAFRRLHYAFEYDWIEDGMLASVRHMAAGLPLYQTPSVTFTPYLYTPIYLYAATALSRIAGLGYPALRLLSILATLGCFGAIYALVYTDVPEEDGGRSRRHLAAIAAVGLFAACYPAVGAAFDVGRVDMLYLFFVLCAFYATRRMNPVVAALLWVCAFQTKQGVLPIALLALCYDWQRPRRIVLGVASFVIGLGGSILWLDHVSHGWYRYYVFGMAGSFGYVFQHALRFVPSDMLAVCGIALLIVVAAVLTAPPALRSPGLSFYALGCVGMIAFTAYIRVHKGANENSLLPMYAWIAVLFGVAMGRLSGLLEARAAASPPAAAGSRAALALLLLAVSAELLRHIYSPGEFLPLPRQIVYRQGFDDQLRSIPGDALVLGHPEDGLRAGKSFYAGSESIGAVVDAKQQGPGDDLMRQYSELLHSGRLQAIALDKPAEEFLETPRVWMPRDFLTLYPLRVRAVGSEDYRFTSEPRWIYMPCTAVESARRLDPHLDTTPCAPAAH